MAKRYWLFKSEPDVFSIQDLAKAKGKRTEWEGVRNYQARNLLRDEIKVGDGVLFYHSNEKPLAIAGIAKVVKSGYVDHTALDPKAKYYDKKSDPDNPAWYMVDVAPVARFDPPVLREDLIGQKGLEEMLLLQRGSRLSVQPVAAKEWRKIISLAGLKSDL